MGYRIQYNNSLTHHGILGQKWGIRRYQNEDGSLTPLGRERYGSVENFNRHVARNEQIKKFAIGAAKIGAAAGAAAIGAHVAKRFMTSTGNKYISEAIGDFSNTTDTMRNIFTDIFGKKEEPTLELIPLNEVLADPISQLVPGNLTANNVAPHTIKPSWSAFTNLIPAVQDGRPTSVLKSRPAREAIVAGKKALVGNGGLLNVIFTHLLNEKLSENRPTRPSGFAQALFNDLGTDDSLLLDTYWKPAIGSKK